MIILLKEKIKNIFSCLFVRSNGKQLAEVSRIFEENKIECSIDEIFDLNNVDKALQKVLNGGSKGKTLLKIDDSEDNKIYN